MYSGFCHGTHCIKTLLEKVAPYYISTKQSCHPWVAHKTQALRLLGPQWSDFHENWGEHPVEAIDDTSMWLIFFHHKDNISNGTHGSARSQLLHAITNISRPYMRGYLPISLLWHNFRYCISWIPTYRILNWYSIQVRLIRGLSLRNPCSLIMNRRSPLYGEIIVFALSSIWHANPGSEDQPIGLGNKTHLILAQWELRTEFIVDIHITAFGDVEAFEVRAALDDDIHSFVGHASACHLKKPQLVQALCYGKGLFIFHVLPWIVIFPMYPAFVNGW